MLVAKSAEQLVPLWEVSSSNLIICKILLWTCFFNNMGQSRPLFRLFSSFSHHNSIINWKTRRWCAWELNPGLLDGRRRRNHWAMAAAQHWACLYQSEWIFGYNLFMTFGLGQKSDHVYGPNLASYCLFSSFSQYNDKYSTNFDYIKAQMVCMGFKPWTAGW